MVVYISDLDVQGDSNIDGPTWIPLPTEVDLDSGLLFPFVQPPIQCLDPSM